MKTTLLIISIIAIFMACEKEDSLTYDEYVSANKAKQADTTANPVTVAEQHPVVLPEYDTVKLTFRGGEWPTVRDCDSISVVTYKEDGHKIKDIYLANVYGKKASYTETIYLPKGTTFFYVVFMRVPVTNYTIPVTITITAEYKGQSVTQSKKSLNSTGKSQLLIINNKVEFYN